MFSRVAAFALAAMPLLAAATPLELAARDGGPSCATGPIQCCDIVEPASAPDATVLLGLLGIVLQDLSVLVGITCSPITVIGGVLGTCSATAVCCEDNSYGGVISIGCVPVTL
ncbi:hypothetical protein GSI_10964 [Ganoderma sinense ZZ0214-1]|uniref:Hydrophobin n=1 Tax=Ganoderma sinense ZZ0214-1 TaxID=1077348 RepID=A0A2G8S210_9APHY|nr:hypothetical protein GSI_10964 [Ganoderma sinense ZZ0214-1]